VYSNNILIGYLLLGVVFLLTLFLLVTGIGNLCVRVPFVPSSRKVAEEMVRFADLKGNETVYDLGAGDGRVLLAAKRLHPGIRAVGWEFVPTVWLLGKLRIWWARQRVTFRLGNSMHHSVDDADCIFLYMFSSVMPALEAKFDRELKPGTKVLSLAFPFPRRQPVARKEVPWLKSVSTIYLYRW
jgi:SAM-dependent methyltransferase